MVPILAAAARHRREQNHEEGEMTRYSTDELNADWEFKIVRSLTPVFNKPGKLQALVEEEARAGWVMLEKLDDQRIRFKRARSERAQDAYLPPDIDPYRTNYGVSMGTQVGVGLAILGILLALVIGLIAALGAEAGSLLPLILPAILILAGLGVAIGAFAARRGTH
jgi:hypothetical protein